MIGIKGLPVVYGTGNVLLLFLDHSPLTPTHKKQGKERVREVTRRKVWYLRCEETHKKKHVELC